MVGLGFSLGVRFGFCPIAISSLGKPTPAQLNPPETRTKSACRNSRKSSMGTTRLGRFKPWAKPCVSNKSEKRKKKKKKKKEKKTGSPFSDPPAESDLLLAGQVETATRHQKAKKLRGWLGATKKTNHYLPFAQVPWKRQSHISSLDRFPLKPTGEKETSS